MGFQSFPPFTVLLDTGGASSSYLVQEQLLLLTGFSLSSNVKQFPDGSLFLSTKTKVGPVLVQLQSAASL